MQENVYHSPRLSFSHDFVCSGSIPVEQNPLQSPTESSTNCSGFDFSVPDSVISGESLWSAEQLFHNGKMVPKEIKNRPESEKIQTGSSKPEPNPIRDNKPVLEIEETCKPSSKPGRTKPETNPIRGIKPDSEIEEIIEVTTIAKRTKTKPFLRFMRRSNREIGLPLLENNSTGSNSKPTGYWYGGNGGGIRVSSIMDVIPSGTLFGLGSIMVGSGSDKIKNKKRAMISYW